MSRDFQTLLRLASDAEASDIHLKAGGPAMFRIRRELRPLDAEPISEEWLTEAIQRYVPERLRDKLERDREIDFALVIPDAGRFRINVYQQRGAPVLALRLVRTVIRSFDQLHLPPIIQRLAESPRGIVLLTGAPGAGKSTTLAAAVEHLNLTARKHIITLEDPIEYFFEDKHSVIEQREVGLDTATFATGLRNVLRQDPDVLVIGEMRDPDSVAAAVSAANAGALVIATLHTGDASRSVRRILDMFPGPEREQARRQLALSLRAVVCQKLVRPRAGGILPALEILVNNLTVSKLIESDRLEKLHGAIEMGAADGMQTFDQALHRFVESGAITVAEALAHSPNAENFRMRLQGITSSDPQRILGSRA